MLRHILPLTALAVASLAFAQDTTLPLGGGADLTVVKIEPGLFQQGSHEAESGRGPDETRRHVTISRAFYLGKSPVTRGQFARFVSETNYRTEAEKGSSGGFGYENGKLVQRKEYTWRAPGFSQTDNHPVVMVTWNDAQAFLGWLSRKTGSKFELPSEAQWEYACRAGTDTPHAGALTPDEVAWHKDNSGLGTHPVGEKPANAWGLTDMLGNVWEWCADWYGPYAEGPQMDPVQENSNLSDKPRRVLRGGSWLKDPAGVRVSTRYRNDPQSRNPDNGFRVMAYKLDVSTALEKLSVPVAAATPVPAATPTPPAVSLQAQSTPMRAPSQPESNPGAVGSDRAPPSLRGNVLTKAYGLLGCSCVAIVVLLFFIRRAFRGGDGGPRPTFSIPGTATPPILPRQGGGGGGTAPRSRIADDGFWIEGGNVPAGTPLKCRYVVGGENQEKDFTFEARPGGQFVYTGQRPSSVSIIVMAAGTAMGAGPPMFDTDTDDEQRRERERREEEEERRRRRRSEDDLHSAY
jgi:formylglycine-generating enzyme required for sulfatase activity